jgi:cell division protein FtsB
MEPPTGQATAGRSRRRSRLVLPTVGSLVALGVLFIGVFPTRAILDQRAELARAEDRLAVVDDRNDELAARVDALNTDAEIERLAREQYNLVRPGEELYNLLPAPPGPPAVPDAWPFRALRAAVTPASATTAT